MKTLYKLALGLGILGLTIPGIAFATTTVPWVTRTPSKSTPFIMPLPYKVGNTLIKPSVLLGAFATTTNSLLEVNGTSSFLDSINTPSVSIGQGAGTVPAHTLDVEGEVKFTIGEGTSDFLIYSGANAYNIFRIDGDQKKFFFDEAANGFKMGLGVSDPAYTLDVGGATQISGDLHLPLLSDGCNSISGGIVTSTGVPCGTGTVNSGTTNRLAYYTGATTLDSANFLTVNNASSRLGINNTSPTQALTLGDTTAGKGDLGFSTSSDAIYSANNRILHFTTNNNANFNEFSHNIFIGIKAGLSLETTGTNSATNNIGIGPGALQVVTTGGTNLAIGSGALGKLTTGANNIALGGALGSAISINQTIGIGGSVFNKLTSGNNNVALGFSTAPLQTGGDGNTFFGSTIFAKTTTENNNVGIGFAAGNLLRGSGNTVVGVTAATIAATSTNGTFIGLLAAPLITDNTGLTNATAIGWGAQVAQSNSLILGTSTASNTTRVGIGTTSPAATLSIGGTTGNIPFYISTTSAIAASTTLYKIDQDGSVTLGGGTPTLNCGIGTCSLDQYANDQLGTITTSGVVTSITVTFSIAKTRIPKCFVSISSSGINSAVSSQSTTAFTISFSASIGTGFANYTCLQ